MCVCALCRSAKGDHGFDARADRQIPELGRQSTKSTSIFTRFCHSFSSNPCKCKSSTFVKTDGNNTPSAEATSDYKSVKRITAGKMVNSQVAIAVVIRVFETSHFTDLCSVAASTQVNSFHKVVMCMLLAVAFTCCCTCWGTLLEHAS